MKLSLFVIDLNPVMMESEERKNVLGVQVALQCVLSLEDFRKIEGAIDGTEGGWELPVQVENKKK